LRCFCAVTISCLLNVFDATTKTPSSRRTIRAHQFGCYFVHSMLREFWLLLLIMRRCLVLLLIALSLMLLLLLLLMLLLLLLLIVLLRFVLLLLLVLLWLEVLWLLLLLHPLHLHLHRLFENKMLIAPLSSKVALRRPKFQDTIFSEWLQSLRK
jgi:hypothetical protein